MAISINHSTFVVTIPKSDTVFIEMNTTTGFEIRSYDEYALMRELADYLDSEAGATLPSAFNHNTTVTISGVSYARTLSFLEPYTFTFENGSYQVKLVGGTNNNILDVLNPNSVSVIPSNSAGLQVYTQSVGGIGTPTEVADAVWSALSASYNVPDTTGAKLNAAGNAGDPWSTDLSTYNTDGTAGKIVKDTGVNVAALPNASTIASAVRTELTTELAHLMALQNGLTEGQATMLLESYRLLGLDPTKPLIVTKTGRSAGAEIVQTIVSNDTQTTVTRA